MSHEAELIPRVGIAVIPPRSRRSTLSASSGEGGSGASSFSGRSSGGIGSSCSSYISTGSSSYLSASSSDTCTTDPGGGGQSPTSSLARSADSRRTRDNNSSRTDDASPVFHEETKAEVVRGDGDRDNVGDVRVGRPSLRTLPASAAEAKKTLSSGMPKADDAPLRRNSSSSTTVSRAPVAQDGDSSTPGDGIDAPEAARIDERTAPADISETSARGKSAGARRAQGEGQHHRRHDSVFDSVSSAPLSSRSPSSSEGEDSQYRDDDRPDENEDSRSDYSETESTSYSDSDISSSTYESDGYGSFSDSNGRTSSGSVTDNASATTGASVHRDGDDEDKEDLSVSYTTENLPSSSAAPVVTPSSAAPTSHSSTGGGDATNCWSDGVFESSGNSTPGGQYREAAVITNSGAVRPTVGGSPKVPVPGNTQPGAPASHTGVVTGFSEGSGASGYRLYSNGSRSGSRFRRGNDRDQHPAFGSYSTASEQGSGAAPRARASEGAGSVLRGARGRLGGGGVSSSSVKKGEARGLRKRARAIRGALLRRGAAAAEKGKGSGGVTLGNRKGARDGGGADVSAGSELTASPNEYRCLH